MPTPTTTDHWSAAARGAGRSPISELMQQALANPSLISLAAGFVDRPSLPVDAAAAATAEILADPAASRWALQYGTTQGDIVLRRLLIERLEREEGAAPGAFAETVGRTIVTTGSQQLLYLVAEALLDPGDIVLVEGPTYFVFLGLLKAHGAVAMGVATDEAGLRVDDLERVLADLDRQGKLDRVKLIYTISEHSNPSGVSLAADRRAELVQAARRWSKSQPIYILEDAAYRGLGFDGPEPPSVWGHDPAGETVILARTFSKTFSPGLKTGWGVLPESLVAPILGLKGSHDFGSNHFAQAVIAHALGEGGYDRQVEALRPVYRRKRDAMLAALDEQLGDDPEVTWGVPSGGIYVWIAFPEGVDSGRDSELFARSVERGVLYVPGAYCYPDGPGAVPTHYARLCYGGQDEIELAEGVRRLAAALDDVRSGTAGSGRAGASRAVAATAG